MKYQKEEEIMIKILSQYLLISSVQLLQSSSTTQNIALEFAAVMVHMPAIGVKRLKPTHGSIKALKQHFHLWYGL